MASLGIVNAVPGKDESLKKQTSTSMKFTMTKEWLEKRLKEHGPEGSIGAGCYTAFLEDTLTATRTKVLELEDEIAYLKTYVIPEKDAHGNYWRELAQKRIVAVSKYRDVSDQLSKALKRCWTQLGDQQAMPDTSSDHVYQEALDQHHALLKEIS